MPPYIPFHAAMVFLSGAAEVVIGALLALPLINDHVNIGAWGAILLLAAVFPANIHCALSEDMRKKVGMTFSQSLIRLPIQFLFFAWAYQLTNKPFIDTVQQQLLLISR